MTGGSLKITLVLLLFTLQSPLSRVTLTNQKRHSEEADIHWEAKH